MSGTYLADGTFAGPAESIAADLGRLIPAFSDVGRELNPQKSEICFVQFKFNPISDIYFKNTINTT